jgi:plasmid stability protein
MAILNIKSLPDDIYRKLKARARRNHRSVTQEVTQILEEAVSQSAEVSLLELRGLGKELWVGIDAQKFVDEERESWG